MKKNIGRIIWGVIFIIMLILLVVYSISSSLRQSSINLECYQYSDGETYLSYPITEGLRIFELKKGFNITDVSVEYLDENSIKVMEVNDGKLGNQRILNCTKWIEVKDATN